NRGFAYACNVGWRKGSAPYVLFLNPDAHIDSTSIQRLVRVAAEEDRVGLVAPKIVDAAGATDLSLRRFSRVRTPFAQACCLARLFRNAWWSEEMVRDPECYERRGAAEWVSGACMLVKRSALEVIGGWDDRFFLYCEDKDLCFRLWRAGFEIRYEPTATAVHIGGASAPRGSLLPTLAQTKIRYVAKYESRRTLFFERCGIALNALTHTLLTTKGRSHRAGYARALWRAVAMTVRLGE